MSFYSNFQSDKCPCAITGNPLNGLTEKVCIQAEKIFDACMKQGQLDNYSLTLTDLTPADPTYPLTFISARSTTSEAVVTNLNVERLAEKPCARVQATVTVPLEVLYTDANGVDGSATASVSIPIDVLLSVPAPSIMPFTVRAVVSAVAPDGTYDATTQGFLVSICATIIIKIAMSVELLVPSYGYCIIPPAQEYSQEVCAGFFELPLYPQSRGGHKGGGGCCNG
ncbi:MAG: hypothetical protein IJX87_05965 [Clostridia bacterium]|nr:hypothetical protein [Clostridia bacterium]